MSECMLTSDQMSCATMTRMAKKEVERFFAARVYTASSPACDFNLRLANRQAEMEILAGNGLSRKICFNPDSLQKGGLWVSQFDLNRPVPAVFDANTRPR